MLHDKRTFPNFLRALLDHRDKIHKLDFVVHNIDPRKATWGHRCRYEQALSKRKFLTDEIKQTLISLGVNKWMAARLTARFIWHGSTAKAEEVEVMLAKRKKCKCAFSG